jgi:hypothetical protein
VGYKQQYRAVTLDCEVVWPISSSIGQLRWTVRVCGLNSIWLLRGRTKAISRSIRVVTLDR